MTKIALAAAALFVATTGAFAASDNYGSANANQPAASVDTSFTASINKSDANVRKPLGSDRDLFGR
jgi:hypothetical protein